jgi:predicted tellurium resistance membrane protein TerC
MANIIVMSVVVPLLVVMPNWALYGFLCLLGGCFGLLFTILFNDIAHFFSKQEHYLVILLVGVLSFIAGYLVYELARVSLTQVVAYNRYPFVLSLCYTASALLPMLLLQVLEKIKSFRFCRVNLYK